jgi:hypothetical protein
VLEKKNVQRSTLNVERSRKMEREWTLRKEYGKEVAPDMSEGIIPLKLNVGRWTLSVLV